MQLLSQPNFKRLNLELDNRSVHLILKTKTSKIKLTDLIFRIISTQNITKELLLDLKNGKIKGNECNRHACHLFPLNIGQEPRMLHAWCMCVEPHGAMA